MILPWPLTTSAELAAVLRPGGHLRADSALRSLRDKGVAATPISVVPRSETGARGRVVWYSSLMLDVCRLVRAGDLDAAAAAHAAADRLAGHRSARFVAEWLIEHAEPDPDPAVLDAETGGALMRLATLTASARAEFGPVLGVETFVGRVRETTGRTALVVSEDGNAVSIPSPRSFEEWGNAPVVVDFEVVDDDSGTLWVRAAFDPEADPHERVPGGPRLLTAAQREGLAALTVVR